MLIAATVLPRRRYPVAAFAAGVAIVAAQVAFGMRSGAAQTPVFALQPVNTDLAIPVLLYTLAARRRRPVSIAGLAVCLLGSAVAIGRWAPAQRAHPGQEVLSAAIGLGGAALIAWVLGDSVAYRYRRAYYASLEERAARLEAERDAQARIAAAAQRELTQRRARVVDEAEARLRGIERDLHDGAQVRLAALAMTLGEIKENLERNADPQRTIGLAGAAHRNAKETLAELRDLAKGIHPAVLDRGLAEALAVLAEASAVPVGLSVGISGRPSPAIEAIAYFCAAELLANVTKHSGASRALISVTDAEDAAIMRDGLTQTLAHRGHDVVAAVGDAEALRQAVASHRPDVAVIDVRMPPTHTDEGLRAALAIRREHPGVGVLVFSQYIEAKAATDLLAGSPAGPAGVGYLLKDRVADVSDFSGLRVSVQFLDLGTRTEVRVHETNVPESFLAPEAQAGFLTSLDRFGTYLAFLSSSA